MQNSSSTPAQKSGFGAPHFPIGWLHRFHKKIRTGIHAMVASWSVKKGERVLVSLLVGFLLLLYAFPWILDHFFNNAIAQNTEASFTTQLVHFNAVESDLKQQQLYQTEKQRFLERNNDPNQYPYPNKNRYADKNRFSGKQGYTENYYNRNSSPYGQRNSNFAYEKQNKLKSNSYLSREAKGIKNIDVNLSTQEDWERLPGIGPYFAAKIIKFREKLGGFAHPDLVKLTYGLADSTFQKIRPYLKANAGQVKQISINTATYEELAAHPLIKWKNAKIIHRYIRENGSLQQPDDLNQMIGLDSLCMAVMPYYLRFQTDTTSTAPANQTNSMVKN